MKISMAADHGGFVLKEELRQYLENEGHHILDNGVYSADAVDYPDMAAKTAHDILDGRAELGVLICGTGIGISIAANRFKGIRAALVTSDEYARLAREHNNANIIALGGRFTSFKDAARYVDIFLSTPFAGARHERRVEKLDQII